MKEPTIAGLVVALLCGAAGLRAQNAPQEPAQERNHPGVKIVLTSVFVDDQAKALTFYTEVLGFVKKSEIPEIRWLTVVSPEEPDGVELLLEPNDNSAAKTFQKALFEQGIPVTSFAVENVQKEYARMSKLGVAFRRPPTKAGPVTIAIFEDTCGNLIQLAQK